MSSSVARAKGKEPEGPFTAERIDNLANSSTTNLAIPIVKSETQERTIGSILKS